MLILALVVVGIFSYFAWAWICSQGGYPTVSVTIANPGAAPEEIETEITKKIEDAVNTISHIDEVRSTSSGGAFAGDRSLSAGEERRRGRPGSSR